MLLNLRNALMTGKRLPYDAEVEFLESTGTQWIDTGYSFNSATDKVELVFEMLHVPSYKWIFGAYDTKRLGIGSGSGTSRRTFAYNDSTSYISNSYYVNGAHTFVADSTGAGIDGSSIFAFSDFTTESHILLYTIPLDPSTYCSNARIWSYKHYRNNTLVRDYIPVRKGTVGYLYDRVSGKLFGNAGTGDFVLGQDVVDITWGDGEYYGQNGSIGYNTNLARIDNYIAVTGGHSITWKWGDSVLGTCYLIVYNAQKQQIDFWSPNSATGERTINLNATGAFVRYSIGKNFKNTTFFKDNTTGLYAVRNGKILLP